MLACLKTLELTEPGKVILPHHKFQSPGPALWSSDRLSETLDMLLDAEAMTRTTGVPAEAVTGRTLMNIAAMARGRI